MAHKSPKERREIVKEYLRLCIDHKRTDAKAMIAKKHGINPVTVAKWANTAEGRPEASAPPNPIYNPFAMTPTGGAVELTREVTTEFFLSDLHFHPEHKLGHDPAAWAVASKALEIAKPDIVFLGGDICDIYAPSRYDKIPRLATPEAFNGEIAYCKEKVKEIRDLAPNARILWLTGNHELRLPRSIATNAPWLYNNIGNVEKMLELWRYEIELVEDGHQVGKLRHYHGHNNPGSGRVNAAKNKFERLLCNAIFGHHHKFSRWYQRDQEGGYFGCFINGTIQWLSTEYAANPDWTQGWSVIHYARSGNFHLDQVLIHKPSVWSAKARAIFAGVEISVDLEKSAVETP